MLLTGAQIIIEILKENGVDTVFGYPGSSVLEIYDELYKNSDSIRHILTSHEQGAAHAADGYARASGKTGVCIATSGPGATNLVTGIASAYMDSVPVLAITCNVERAKLGKDSFQEVDIAGITMPVTKHGYIIKDISMLARAMRRAFEITREGRPGPVIVDITKNVLSDTFEYESSTANGAVEEKGANANTDADANVGANAVCKAELKNAVSLIKAAKRPLILVGGGVVRSETGAFAEELAELTDAPIICSLMGKGAVNETGERFIGMIGVEGSSAAKKLADTCDTLIALGIRFSDRMTGYNSEFASEAKIIQLDIDPAEINKNVAVKARVLGDLRSTLPEICSKLHKTQHITWNKNAAKLKTEELSKGMESKDGLSGREVIDCVYRLTEGEAVITTEVGQHQLFAANGYRTAENGKFITSGGLGTMGYGLSAAIGAKLALPEKTVINFAGDGCFRMNMNELLTASRHKIPIVQIVFDNQILGLVYKWQGVLFDGRYSATEFNDKLDFVKLAEALGVKAFRITRKEELEETIKTAISLEEPVVIDCVIKTA